MTYLVDVDLLVKSLLTRFLPDVEAAPETDVDTIDELPMIIFAAGQGEGTNGALRLAQLVPVTFTVLDTQRDGRSAIANGKATCDALTEVVVERFPRSRVPDVGVISSIEDARLFTRTAATALGAKDVSQFNGTFTFIVRPLT
jgi:hypothetical protein